MKQNKTKVKGIKEKTEILDAINKGFGNKKFNEELHGFIYSLYTMVNDNIPVNNISISHLRKCNQIVKNTIEYEIQNIQEKIDAENVEYMKLTKNHEEYISKMVNQKNQLENRLTLINDEILKYDKNLRMNDKYKKDTFASVIYKYNEYRWLDDTDLFSEDDLLREIKDGYYEFSSVREFMESFSETTKKYIGSEICCEHGIYSKYNNRDMDDLTDIDRRYIVILNNEIYSGIINMCINLLKREE